MNQNTKTTIEKVVEEISENYGKGLSLSDTYGTQSVKT